MKHKPKLIVFIGIDGSGKTTQAKILEKQFTNRDVKVNYSWSRRIPYFLNVPSKIFKKIVLKEKGKTEGDNYKSVMKNRHNFLSNRYVSYLIINLLLMEYFVFLQLKVFKPNRKKKILILDRYLQDALVDFICSYKNNVIGDYQIINLFPLPDLLFFIDIEPGVAIKRKNDTSIEYLEDRVSIYRDIAKRFHAIEIDGSLPIKEISEKILTETERVIDQTM